MNNELSLHELLTQLPARVSDAAASMLRPLSDDLRRVLRESIDGFGANTEAGLADPVLEPMFGWKTAHQTTMGDLAGNLLDVRLVDVLNNPDSRHVDEYRFPKSRSPFVHQLVAWRDLLERKKSVLVSSGTGSGKTECFLIPILSEMTREASEPGGGQPGVRALFIYPLNALIRSQRDRLTAWTSPLKGSVRFGLFTGRMEKEVRGELQRESPWEVLSRNELRRSAPQLLVTNTTMLEYMLVRNEDAPILQQSQGRLRWIVIDEAHSYAGAKAAELSLLLRRVMLAFGGSPDQVRFVATSATLGSDSEAANEKLRRFLADLAGCSVEQVSVVHGQREVPLLQTGMRNDSSAFSLEELEQENDSGVLFEKLQAHEIARSIRDAVTESETGPVRLSDLGPVAGETDPKRIARWIDVCTRAIDLDQGVPYGQDKRFLPLRFHLVQRTVDGIWVCLNRDCAGKKTQGLKENWGLGSVFFDRRSQCSHCESAVVELKACGDCGLEVASALERHGSMGAPRLSARPLTSNVDDFLIDEDVFTDAVEYEEDEAEGQHIGAEAEVLVFGQTADDASLASQPRYEVNVAVAPGAERLAELAVAVESDCGHCPSCGRQWLPNQGLRPLRISAPFILDSSIPLLLEQSPMLRAIDDSIVLPAHGRRLLAFTDSRQRTARLSARLADRSERSYIRYILKHLLASNRLASVDDGLADEIAIYEANTTNNPAFLQLIERKKTKLAEQQKSGSRMSWIAARDRVAALSWVKGPIKERIERKEGSGFNVAEWLMLRELYRRPRRQNSCETMGLVSLRYPFIETAPVPASWQALPGATPSDWRDFLKLILDFWVRENAVVGIGETILRWMGSPIRPKRIVTRVPNRKNGELGWPQPLDGTQRRNRFARLISEAFHLDLGDPERRHQINDVMQLAVEAIAPGLGSDGRGRFLDFTKCELAEPGRIWVCPTTSRLLDTTLRGITPYLLVKTGGVDLNSRLIDLPELPKPFWEHDAVPMQERQEWLNSQAIVRELRSQGVWTEAMDRAYLGVDYFRAEEHSAQIGAFQLDKMTEGFKLGEVNVLSCSTTMEMGVDIGGLSVVAMTNPPPHPANFLQRAGRAGRRSETRALSLTVVRADPPGLALWREPRWPFQTPISVPRVALDSQRLVQRHVNAFLLSRFLVQETVRERHRLNADWFFSSPNDGQTPSVAERFVTWLRNPDQVQSMRSGLDTLTSRSALEGADPVSLAEDVAIQMETVNSRWVAEISALTAELTSTDLEAGQTALKAQIDRIGKEYLLSTLITEGFLPAHSFPTHVVNFLLDEVGERRKTRFQSSYEPRQTSETSRTRSIALQEFQPGAEIVVDHAVYRSAGLTLNWHIPATADAGVETQNLRWFHGCTSCGYIGTLTLRPEHCGGCGREVRESDRWRYIEPAGFSVAAGEKPGNRQILQPKYLPEQSPRFSAGVAPWVSLPDATLGRFRGMPDGTIVYSAAGEHGEGFALCMRCGAAEPLDSSTNSVNHPLHGHRHLRTGKTCPGNEQPFAICNSIRLACVESTDLLEVEIRNPTTGDALEDETTVFTIAALLRRAICAKLGIEIDEVGVSTQQFRESGGPIRRSAFLFDTASGGAGYVSGVADQLPELFAQALKFAECSMECPDSCPACLLSADLRRHASKLNRHLAITVLGSSGFLNRLQLPESLQILGPDSRAEQRPMPLAIEHAVNTARDARMRIYVGGNERLWEIRDWNLHRTLSAMRERKVGVSIAVAGAIGSLDPQLRRDLAALLNTGLVSGIEQVTLKSGDPALPLAELRGAERSIAWQSANNVGMEPGPSWGQDPNAPIIRGSQLPQIQVRLLTESEIAPKPASGGNAWDFGKIAADLGGKTAKTLGKALVQRVTEVASPVGELLATGSPAKITYSDRYLVNPANAVTLWSVIEGLIDGHPRPVLEISSSSERGNGNLDWASDHEREAFMKALFRDYPSVHVHGRSKIDMGHARELTVHYADGRSLYLRFDQGMGSWRLERAASLRGDPQAAARQVLNRPQDFLLGPWKGNDHSPLLVKIL